MAVYFVTGTLGSGKSLVCVGKAFDYIKQGRRVATNLDLFAAGIMKRNCKQSITRIPDKPRVSDLTNIGLGCDVLDEDRYGLLILDECGTWLNSRNWSDPERKGFIDWMLHARKLRWDVLIIVQHESVVDKQLRESLCEHLVICKRLDRLQIPYVSALTKLFFGVKVTFPKVHRAKVYYGETKQDLVADNWTYMAKHLYKAYNTEQVFEHDEIIVKDEPVDMRATFTILPRWHIEGRYYQRRPFWPRITNPFDLLVIPTWLLSRLVSFMISKASARRSDALCS
jgi:hypothetical protein